MFLGEYQHSLDAKGRVILPARFRDQLEGGAVMAKALDGCLAVYPDRRVPARGRQPAGSPVERGARERQAARTFFAGAVEITPDKQGRVAIPQHLREYAGLDREVIVAGNFDHIEIWDAATFRETRRGRASPRSSKARASTTSSERTTSTQYPLTTDGARCSGPVFSPPAGAVVGPYSARFQP